MGIVPEPAIGNSEHILFRPDYPYPSVIESDLRNGLAIWVLNVDWQAGLELPLELIGLRA